MRRNYWIWSLIFVIFLIAGACGGGGGGGGGGVGNLNSLFDGEYVINQTPYASGTIGTPMLGNLTASGDGTATASFGTTINLSYNVNTDRTIHVDPVGGGGAKPADGILSADGRVLAMSNTEYHIGSSAVMALAVAKSSIAATTVIGANNYIISQAGTNSSGFYTSRVLVTVNGSGITGTFWVLSHSQNPSTLPSGSLTISAPATTLDGTFIVNNGSADYPGVITPDGNIFSQIGTNTSDQVLAMGVKKATTGTPDVIGEYLLNEIGLSSQWSTPYISRVKLVVGSGTYDYQVLAHSVDTSPLDSGTGIAYSISQDGTLTFPSNTGWGGIASPDGSVLVFSNTTSSGPADNFFAVGIKKP